mgnify:CR=1 FL=1
MLELLISYFVRVLPGIVLAVFLLYLLPKKQTAFRMTIYILLFILTRDAMTPMGLWRFGKEGFFWLRFINDPLMLIVLGLISAGNVVVMNLVDKDLKNLLVWHKGSKIKSILFGTIGALIVAMPVLVFYLSTPIEIRGGKPEIHIIIPILIVALLGNLYEETLFRGYFQGYIEKWVTPIKAAVLSGLLFGFGHSFLSLTVTDIGWPLLLFATYEGIIAGFVRMKYGLIGATLTHGLAIFLLASGLI